MDLVQGVHEVFSHLGERGAAQAERLAQSLWRRARAELSRGRRGILRGAESMEGCRTAENAAAGRHGDALAGRRVGFPASAAAGRLRWFFDSAICL